MQSEICVQVSQENVHILIHWENKRIKYKHEGWESFCGCIETRGWKRMVSVTHKEGSSCPEKWSYLCPGGNGAAVCSHVGQCALRAAYFDGIVFRGNFYPILLFSTNSWCYSLMFTLFYFTFRREGRFSLTWKCIKWLLFTQHRPKWISLWDTVVCLWCLPIFRTFAEEIIIFFS